MYHKWWTGGAWGGWEDLGRSYRIEPAAFLCLEAGDARVNLESFRVFLYKPVRQRSPLPTEEDWRGYAI